MGGNVARATSPAGAVRTYGSFLEPDRARGEWWRRSERFRVCERSPTASRMGGMCLTGTECGRKLIRNRHRSPRMPSSGKDRPIGGRTGISSHPTIRMGNVDTRPTTTLRVALVLEQSSRPLPRFAMCRFGRLVERYWSLSACPVASGPGCEQTHPRLAIATPDGQQAIKVGGASGTRHSERPAGFPGVEAGTPETRKICSPLLDLGLACVIRALFQPRTLTPQPQPHVPVLTLS